jgi:hypothetical protein
MPNLGAKKRETKSKPSVVAEEVTATPSTGTETQRPKSGFKSRTIDSESTSTT